MKLFISYAHDDKAWVYELWRLLQDEGHHDAWIDRRIVPAADWWTTILDNVEACECFIYVMTPKSIESIYCRTELDYAVALNKPILPLMLKSCTMPENLTNKHIQYQLITDEMNLHRVLFKIEQRLGEIRVAPIKGKYEPQTAPRPAVPTPTRKPEHVFEVFALAEEAVASGNITLAEQFYAQVIVAEPDGLGQAAKERLDEIMAERNRDTAYANVRRLAENPVTKKSAIAALRAFKRQYGDYDPDQLGAFLKEQVNIPQTKRASSTISIYDLLPPPFDWINIPAGQVTLEAGHGTFDVPAFTIAKYPVTVAQYEVFMNEDGYTTDRWWTTSGWQWLNHVGYTTPRLWDDREWQSLWKPDHPVVGISWFEAYAFTQWLSEKTGENITLPTEQQWQRAAQGDDGRTYPWGNDWDASRCNNDDAETGWEKRRDQGNTTSPVTKYEGKGDSPFGVVDMAGNVWEWTNSAYNTAQPVDIEDTNMWCVLRGGSWFDYTTFYRASARFGNLPWDWLNFDGFRCARSY